MSKYHPGDKVTVRAIVRHNCLSPNFLGVVICEEDDEPRQTTTIPVSAIVSHEKVPLRKGDKVKMAFPNGSHLHSDLEFTVICICDGHAWIKNGNSSPITFSVDKLERV